MILTIAGFEVHQRLRRISTYVYFLVFFSLSALFVCVAGGAIAGASVDFGTAGKVFLNSPYALNNIIVYISLLGLVVTGSLAGQATYQDIDSDSAVFFYSSPISKLDYLGGRYLGALAIQVLIFSSIGLGAWCAVHLPWIDPSRLGPDRIAAYLQPYLILVWPNLIFFTAIFFALAALLRRMLPVYAASVLMLIGFLVAAELSSNLNVNVQAALADPFGATAIDRLTQYWTPFQRNTQLIPLGGILLANRALWMGLGALILVITYLKFAFAYPQARGKKQKRIALEEGLVIPAAAGALRSVQPTFSGSVSFTQFASLTRIQFVEIVKNVFFGVLVLAGACLAIIFASGIDNPFATPVYPVTYIMVAAAAAGFSIFALAITTFYAGELVWKERDAQLNQIMDALPVERWVLFGSKLAALMLVQVVLVLVIMASGMIVQISHGYYHFEFGVYLKELLVNRLVQYWIVCAIALFVHTVINQKYVGHFVMILYFVGLIATNALGLQDFLYRLGQAPPFIYSGMNGYGPYATPLFWFKSYWVFGAAILVILTSLLWVRGTEPDWRVRGKIARERLSGPVKTAVVTCAAMMFCVGAYIYHNTHVLNRYQTTFQVDEQRAQYEKKYRQYLKLPHPRVTDIKVQFDLDPENRSVLAQGQFWLENKTDQPIDRVALTIWPVDLTPLQRPHIAVKKLSFTSGQTPEIEDNDLGFYIYKLGTPLAPHGRVELDTAIQYDNPGFVNSNPNTDIVKNGTALGDRYLPYIGYADDIELADDSTRHRHGLEKEKRLPKLEDVAARSDNMISNEGDWLNFEATVSTAPDQIAVLPGYLQKEWTENGRRYFHYKMDAPMLKLYSLNSARYAVKRDKWRDVSLEIYYQPGHEFDLDRMMDSMKASLEYCSSNFSPFQFHQLRILEFPRYQAFAASFANTIPFSESIGFITFVDAKNPDSLDLPFYVTAHETAHQWWGHQVVSANVEGATSIVETLAQYSAMMIMKHRLGDQSMKRFLRYNLDGYLRGRGQERNEEKPLDRVEPNQGYIHYLKGAVVMYELQDYIGEDKVNQALADFVKAYGFKGAPYATSLDMIAYFRKVTPPEYQFLYEDLFENITLYSDRTKSATYTQMTDGKYEVHIAVECKKTRADDHGQETPVPLHDWMDVGVMDGAGKYLYLKKQKVDSENSEFTVVVDKLPAKAGIDPLNKMIDRNADDNVVNVTKK
jgi:ABC-2 type transport system permease protein